MNMNVYVSKLPKKEMLALVVSQKTFDNPEVNATIAEFIEKIKKIESYSSAGASRLKSNITGSSGVDSFT